jgi:hypothetical protein
MAVEASHFRRRFRSVNFNESKREITANEWLHDHAEFYASDLNWLARHGTHPKNTDPS